MASSSLSRGLVDLPVRQDQLPFEEGLPLEDIDDPILVNPRYKLDDEALRADCLDERLLDAKLVDARPDDPLRPQDGVGASFGRAPGCPGPV